MNKQRWWGVIALLCLVVIGYVDRVNISVMLANPEFKAYFGLGGDRIQQGSLMTAFLLGYGLSAILLTPVLETLTGYRKGLTLSIACWAVLTAISPLAGSLLFLLFLRTLLVITLRATSAVNPTLSVISASLSGWQWASRWSVRWCISLAGPLPSTFWPSSICYWGWHWCACSFTRVSSTSLPLPPHLPCSVSAPP